MSKELSLENKILKESRVGAFYIIGNNIVSNDVDVRDGDEYGDFINYSSHWDLWNEFSREYPEFSNLDYDYFPRGRVVYNKKDHKYILYIDDKLDNAGDLNIIENQYKLRTGSYIRGKDEHYQSLQKRESKKPTLKENVVYYKRLYK